MRAVVVYESMFGNTRLVAEAIGGGLGPPDEVVVIPVGRAGPEVVADADLVVVGGPTHAHGMSRTTTRHSAADLAAKPENNLVLDPDARGPGVREWCSSLGPLGARVAVFDTRIKAPAWLTGQAARGIARQLRRHGLDVVAAPESFFVTKDNQLRPGEEIRARAWGERLAGSRTPSL